MPAPRCSANWPKTSRSIFGPGWAASMATAMGACAACACPAAPLDEASAHRAQATVTSGGLFIFSPSLLLRGSFAHHSLASNGGRSGRDVVGLDAAGQIEAAGLGAA